MRNGTVDVVQNLTNELPKRNAGAAAPGRGRYAEPEEADETGAGDRGGRVRLERNRRHLAKDERSIKVAEISGSALEEFPLETAESGLEPRRIGRSEEKVHHEPRSLLVSGGIRMGAIRQVVNFAATRCSRLPVAPD